MLLTLGVVTGFHGEMKELGFNLGIIISYTIWQGQNYVGQTGSTHYILLANPACHLLLHSSWAKNGFSIFKCLHK